MKELKLKVNSQEETIKFANLLTHYLQPNSFIALSGDLGAGKTTFTKGIGEALGVKRVINSPTFTIMKTYVTNNLNGINMLYHLDVYRLNDSKGDFELEEYFYMDGLCVVEWCDIIKDLIPFDYIRIDFSIIGDTNRVLDIKEFGNIDIIEKLENELKERSFNYEIICR